MLQEVFIHRYWFFGDCLCVTRFDQFEVTCGVHQPSTKCQVKFPGSFDQRPRFEATEPEGVGRREDKCEITK